MFKKLWDAFCLTMGVSTKEGDAQPVDKWAEQKEIARQEEERRRQEREEKWGNNGGAEPSESTEPKPRSSE